MARYVPQHLFDGLVIYRLMAELAGKNDIFDELIARYRDSYPDDDTNALVADVNAAAVEGRKILAALPVTGERHEMAVLPGLLEIFKEDATRGAGCSRIISSTSSRRRFRTGWKELSHISGRPKKCCSRGI
jgi:hypothetical protein